MTFKRYEPASEIAHLIECYWMISDDDAESRLIKIIPDGFPEIIFHYGDPYLIKLNGEWQLQGKILLAGQVSSYFSLKNTGKSMVIGVKFKPAAIAHLFCISMHPFKDRVVEPLEASGIDFRPMRPPAEIVANHRQVVLHLEKFFSKISAESKISLTAADHAVELVFQKNGMVTVAELCKATHVGERQLLNLFNRYVGISPKRFARIVRMNHIFSLVKDNDRSWSSMAYEAAFFDQAHFIKDFQQFTGESPSHYAFDADTMANFFLMRK
jgi:AraC-like DNA-binding protein